MTIPRIVTVHRVYDGNASHNYITWTVQKTGNSTRRNVDFLLFAEDPHLFSENFLKNSPNIL